MRKNNNLFNRLRVGFTLTEILIVVVIIGILATLALPMLVKTLEKAKLGEAASNLNLIRTGEKIYFLEYRTFSNNLSELNIEDPNNQANRYFDYTITAPAPTTDFTSKAARRDGKYSGKAVYIDKSGTVTADSGYFTP